MKDLALALREQFGRETEITPLIAEDRMGRRIHGVDLTRELSATQAELMVSLLDQFKIITFPDQNRASFRVGDLERLANHFGAPIPHPKNYANYIEFKKKRVPLRLLPRDEQTASRCDQAFPEAIQCRPGADSPAVYVVTNLVGSGAHREEETVGGLHWHTDIEFEPIPLSTSMFYVQSVPSTRNGIEGTWVNDQPREEGFYHPESSAELMARRNKLPLNGETAYADTAAAFADLDAAKQAELESVLVRRRLRVGDEGWLIPLVYQNPRTGEKSLHSPIWASRGKNIAPVEVDGLSADESRAYLDELEAHILQPKYRYDHQHTPGDVTLWSNFSTVHNAPPAKAIINDPNDARLMYRISCKGEPCYSLPRTDSDEWIDRNISPPYRSPEALIKP